jgi:DNA repair exonuclease SbcCD ATPase subunit
MSKLETVRSFNDTGPPLQIVQAVASLQQTVEQLRQSLDQLPNAIASETAAALQPLASLQQDVQQALASYDQITAVQRQSLDELATELTQQATAQVNEAISRLNQNVSHLQTVIQSATASAGQMQSLPNALRSEANRLKDWIERLQREIPPLWLRMVNGASAAALGSVLSIGVLMWLGILDSSSPAPPGDGSAKLQQVEAANAQWQRMYEQAPPKTRAWIEQWWQQQRQ